MKTVEGKRQELEANGWHLGAEWDEGGYSYLGLAQSPEPEEACFYGDTVGIPKGIYRDGYGAFRELAINSVIEKAYTHYRNTKLLAELRAIAKQFLEAEEFIDQEAIANSEVLRLVVADYVRTELSK